jgi:hypothetical protein
MNVTSREPPDPLLVPSRPVGRLAASARRWRAIAVTVVAVVLASIGYAAVMSGSALYDDEGYVLMSLQQFLAGSALYDQTYTQYGPLFFELIGVPFRVLGEAPSHDSARVLTLVFWLTASACVGLMTWQFSGRALGWGLVGFVLTFVVLLPITSEPLHPGGFLTVVVAALAADLAFVRDPARRYLIAGLLVAALALTKINVGGLAAFAILFALAIDYTPRTAVERLGRRAALAGCAVLPLALTGPSFGVSDWRWLAMSLAATLIVIAIVVRPRGAHPRRAVAQMTFGGVGLVAVVVLITLATGTSFRGLVNGVLVEPLGY